MNLLRAFVLALLGIPVCAGVVSAFLTFVVLGFTAGPPLEPRDLVAGLVSSVLAGIVLVVSSFATLRVRREGGTGVLAFLARAVPVLVLLGAGLGVDFALSVQEGRRSAEREDIVELCTFPSFWNTDAANCATRAEQCVKHPRPASPDELSAFSNELVKLSQARDARERAHQDEPDPARSAYVEALTAQFNTTIARQKRQSRIVCMALQR
jgi:hypothetical protein